MANWQWYERPVCQVCGRETLNSEFPTEDQVQPEGWRLAADGVKTDFVVCLDCDGGQPTLYQTREMAGISRAELGRRSGVSKSAVCRIELTMRKPSVTTAISLARALGVTVEQIRWDTAAVA